MVALAVVALVQDDTLLAHRIITGTIQGWTN